MAKVSANSPESMFSDESKVFRVLVYKPCTRYFVSQSIIRGNKTADKEDDADDYDDDDADNADIYIMMKCLCVTKNDHFLLGVSCNHLNPPSPPCTTPGQF